MITNPRMLWQPLRYVPPEPAALGDVGAPAGLNALGGVLKFLGMLLGKKPQTEVVLRGFLGLNLEDSNQAVVVKAVLPKSPAAEAGVITGDIIRSFQGQVVTSTTNLQSLALQVVQGQAVKLDVVRNGTAKTIQIQAGKGL